MRRRAVLACGCSAALLPRLAGANPPSPHRQWVLAAEQMKARAEAAGDQPYGAVLVLDGQLVGEGPSRVITRQDAEAHAEREALRDARQRLGRTALHGALLYSTSRPCALCEDAAAAAGVSRMFFGAAAVDAGPPVRRR